MKYPPAASIATRTTRVQRQRIIQSIFDQVEKILVYKNAKNGKVAANGNSFSCDKKF